MRFCEKIKLRSRIVCTILLKEGISLQMASNFGFSMTTTPLSSIASILKRDGCPNSKDSRSPIHQFSIANEITCSNPALSTEYVLSSPFDTKALLFQLLPSCNKYCLLRNIFTTARERIYSCSSCVRKILLSKYTLNTSYTRAKYKKSNCYSSCLR